MIFFARNLRPEIFAFLEQFDWLIFKKTRLSPFNTRNYQIFFSNFSLCFLCASATACDHFRHHIDYLVEERHSNKVWR